MRIHTANRKRNRIKGLEYIVLQLQYEYGNRYVHFKSRDDFYNYVIRNGIDTDDYSNIPWDNDVDPAGLEDCNITKWESGSKAKRRWKNNAKEYAKRVHEVIAHADYCNNLIYPDGNHNNPVWCDDSNNMEGYPHDDDTGESLGMYYE